MVVASPLEQTVQIRQPAQHGVSHRPLPQRPAGAAGSVQPAPLGVQAHQRVGHDGPPRHMRARRASRSVITPAFPPAYLLLSPNRIVPAARSPRRSLPRRPPAARRGGPGRIGIPVIRADGWSAHGTKVALRCSPGRSPSCPPNGDPVRARSPVRSPLRLPTPGGSPTFPADVRLVVPPDTATGRPSWWLFTSSSPGPAQVGYGRGRASGGRRPAGLVVHGIA